MSYQNNYEERLHACQTILAFMGDLADRYKASEYKQMWKNMDSMRDCFGDVFTAATINKDPKDAELALVRPVRHMVPECRLDPVYPDQAAGQRLHHAYPEKNRRHIARRFVAMLVAGLIALVLVTMAASSAAVCRSDEVIARADAIIMSAEGGR